MKFKRLIASLMLLFAVWMPLDNALAAAVIEGCPMMTPAFSQGWQKLWASPSRSVGGCPMHEMTAAGESAVSWFSPHLMSYHCADQGGCHCSWCLLLGSPALPATGVVAPMTIGHSRHAVSADFSAPASRVSALFRPPIV